jgi:hypothetical protein
LPFQKNESECRIKTARDFVQKTRQPKENRERENERESKREEKREREIEKEKER